MQDWLNAAKTSEELYLKLKAVGDKKLLEYNEFFKSLDSQLETLSTMDLKQNSFRVKYLGTEAFVGFEINMNIDNSRENEVVMSCWFESDDSESSKREIYRCTFDVFGHFNEMDRFSQCSEAQYFFFKFSSELYEAIRLRGGKSKAEALYH